MCVCVYVYICMCVFVCICIYVIYMCRYQLFVFIVGFGRGCYLVLVLPCFADFGQLNACWVLVMLMARFLLTKDVFD